MIRITCLDDSDSSPVAIATTRRNRAYGEFLARLRDGEVLEAGQSDLAAALERLAARGLLGFRTEADGAIVVEHIASAETARGGDEDAWPDSVRKRLAKSRRTSVGALFTFPGEAGQGDLEVFITDWSPCPAACALALHRYHPYLHDVQVPADVPATWFTGRHVRHPLTGDLLPVWVADWVKPDFGTGAVLVNPAHDAVDLAFGRAIGLPIRFALLPDGASDDPAAWPVPPVIRTGTAARTGRWDGLAVDDARAAYREMLLERGLARDHTDVRLPAAPIARLTPDAAGAWAWQPRRGRVEPWAGAEAEECAVRASLDAGPALACAAVAGRADILLISATAQKSAAVTLAALVGDLAGAPGEIIVTQTADYAGQRDLDAAMRLAYLVAGDPTQSVALRKQLLEQAESFLSASAAIRERLADSGEEPPGTVGAALARADPVAAFRDLHKWQKEVLRGDGPVSRQAYRPALFALTGAG